MRDALLTMAGVVLVPVTLRDAWHTVFQPSGSSALDRLVARSLWVPMRWWGGRHHRIRALAGPLALSTVVAL